MLKIGITGGIGTGKSTVCRIFEVLGIPVFYADSESKNILEQDEDVVRLIKQNFGTALYSGDILDKKKLAAIVFNQPDKLAVLNGITHPAVFKKFEAWANEQHNVPYVLKEAALIYEAGADKALDHVIVVTAPEALRISRLASRDGVSEIEIRARMKNQWPEEEKIKRADFIIQNDADQFILILQVLKIHDQLVREAVIAGLKS